MPSTSPTLPNMTAPDLRRRKTVLASGEVATESSHYRPRKWGTDPPRASVFAHIPVAAVMTKDVICVRPDVPIDVVLALLIENGIGGMPVVDSRGIPLGFISKTDLVRQRYSDHRVDDLVVLQDLAAEPGVIERATVADLMLPVAFSVSEHAPMIHAAAVMAREKVHRLAVCSDAGDVVGVVTTMDITRFLARYASCK
jgi:CBS domain-containing protein